MSRADLETLLNVLVPLAKEQLDRTGSFPPMAAGLEVEGEIEVHVPRPDEGGEAEALVDLLRAALREAVGEGRYRAVGYCVEVEAEPPDMPPVDAIAVHLESPAERLVAFVPYVVEEDGSTSYRDAFFGAAEAEVFGAEEPA